MLWGLDSETWLRLWGGAIGSLVSAVVGGLVALLVVRLTTRQQRTNAREGREIAAMADLVTATGGMLKKYDDPDAIQDLLLTAEAAAVRWDIDSDIESLGDEIHSWPYLMGRLALDVFKEPKDSPSHRAAFTKLSGAQAWLMVEVTAWSKMSRREREHTVTQMSEKRHEWYPQLEDSEEASSDGEA